MMYGNVVSMNSRKMETTTKILADHRRLEMLELLSKKPELSVAEVAKTLKLNFGNTSDHINKLTAAGLVMKRHDSQFVRHKLTTRGQLILKYLKTLT